MTALAAQANGDEPSQVPWQFSLKSLVLVTMWISMCAGLLRAFVPIGLLFILLSMPALIRTMKAAVQVSAAHNSLGMRAMIATFVQSLGLVVSIIFVSCVTLTSGCFAACVWATGIAAKLCAWTAQRIVRFCGHRGWLRVRATGGFSFCYSANTSLIRRFRNPQIAAQ